jgi:hypothetical protein
MDAIYKRKDVFVEIDDTVEIDETVETNAEIDDLVEAAFAAFRNGHVDAEDQADTVGFAVSGTFIAHGKLTVAEKVELILELLANRAVIFDWTVPQLARLFGISPGSVYRATKPRSRKPDAPLATAGRAPEPPPRLEFAKRVSPEVLFDTAVAAVD